MLALFGRAEARDFVTCIALEARYGLDRLSSSRGKGSRLRHPRSSPRCSAVRSAPARGFELDDARYERLGRVSAGASAPSSSGLAELVAKSRSFLLERASDDRARAGRALTGAPYPTKKTAQLQGRSNPSRPMKFRHVRLTRMALRPDVPDESPKRTACPDRCHERRAQRRLGSELRAQHGSDGCWKPPAIVEAEKQRWTRCARNHGC